MRRISRPRAGRTSRLLALESLEDRNLLNGLSLLPAAPLEVTQVLNVVSLPTVPAVVSPAPDTGAALPVMSTGSGATGGHASTSSGAGLGLSLDVGLNVLGTNVLQVQVTTDLSLNNGVSLNLDTDVGVVGQNLVQADAGAGLSLGGQNGLGLTVTATTDVGNLVGVNLNTGAAIGGSNGLLSLGTQTQLNLGGSTVQVGLSGSPQGATGGGVGIVTPPSLGIITPPILSGTGGQVPGLPVNLGSPRSGGPSAPLLAVPPASNGIPANGIGGAPQALPPENVPAENTTPANPVPFVSEATERVMDPALIAAGITAAAGQFPSPQVALPPDQALQLFGLLGNGLLPDILGPVPVVGGNEAAPGDVQYVVPADNGDASDLPNLEAADLASDFLPFDVDTVNAAAQMLLAQLGKVGEEVLQSPLTPWIAAIGAALVAGELVRRRLRRSASELVLAGDERAAWDWYLGLDDPS